MNALPATLWNSLPAPGFLLDRNNMITDANTAAEHFVNMSMRRLIGAPILERLSIEGPIDATLLRVRRDHSPVFMKNVSVTRGGATPVICNIQFAPLLGEAGAVLMLIEPQIIYDNRGRANPAKSAMLSAVGMAEMLAHEIKNPLAGITGAAQLLAMELDGEGREMTDLIVAESRRIVILLDQVEHFGDLRAPECVPVSIHDVLDQACKSAMLGFAVNMTIQKDYDPSLPVAHVDPNQMIQVFLNLLKNASQAAAPKGGKLVIRTFYDTSLRLRSGDDTNKTLPLQVEIIDDGPGVPDAIADDIFEPFVSGRENGTGLGLALVSKTISDHGGWISVDSSPGRTVFRISLPVATEDIQGQG